MHGSAATSDALEAFIAALEAVPHSAVVTNPYRLPHRSANLRAYLAAALAQPGRRMLLVGEALGYRGGLLTGIPFSSSALLARAPHPFLRQLAPALVLPEHTAEATASIAWACLARRRTVPLFWNAFPFHPHRAGLPESNRAPTRNEVEEGVYFLRTLAALQRPALIAGVGRKGADAARRAFPDRRVISLRHPSYGGKADFETGLRRLYRRRITQGRATGGRC